MATKNNNVKTEETTVKGSQTSDTPRIVDVRNAPMSLTKLVEMSMKYLEKVSQDINRDIETAADETMKNMGLDPNDGWRIDLSSGQFVKLEL